MKKTKLILQDLSTHRFSVSVVLFVCVVIWFGFITKRFDNSWDGLWYHKAIIVKAINPDFYFAWVKPDFAGRFADTDYVNSYYPIILQLASTVIVYISGKLNFSNLTNLICLTIMVHYFYRCAELMRLSVFWTTLLCIIAILNPVPVSQWHTSMIDGAQYYISGAAIFAGLSCRLTSGKSYYFSAIFLAFLSFSIKFNSILIVPIVLLLTVPLRRLDIRTLSSLLLLAAIVLWHPYINNWLVHGSALYPFNSGDPDEIIFKQVSPEFLQSSYPVRFFKSIFSLPINSKLDQPDLSIHFNQINWSVLSAPDVRFGGFGPYFGYILAASLIANVLTIWKLKGADDCGLALTILGVSFAFLCFAMIHPAGWWARYAPYLWLIPVMTLLSANSAFKQKKKMPAFASVAFFCWVLLIFFHIETDQASQLKALKGEFQKVIPGAYYGLDKSNEALELSSYQHGPALTKYFSELGATLTPSTDFDSGAACINLQYGNRACRLVTHPIPNRIAQ